MLLNKIKTDPKSNYTKTFNSWKLDNSDQGIYHYKCLVTAKLDVTVEIPFSLHTLLTEVMEGNKTEDSCADIATHETKITISIKEPAADTDSHKLTLTPDNEVIITDVNALLALFIVLKCYPTTWKNDFFWDAWLAVAIQLYVQGNFQTEKEVFPTLWMDRKGIFLAESQVAPKNVRCLLLGQDPVSDNDPSSCKATGIAFHNIGNNNTSIKNMGKYYKLDCSNDKPREHCQNGILMVNMIRCIFVKSKSVSGNDFKIAWTAYTLRLANYFNKQLEGSNIIVFCKSPYNPCLVEKYLPKVVSPEKFMHVHHPCRVWMGENRKDKDVEKVAKCLERLQLN